MEMYTSATEKDLGRLPYANSLVELLDDLNNRLKYSKSR